MRKKLFLITAIAIGLTLLASSLAALASDPEPTTVIGRTWVYYGGHTFTRWSGVDVKIEDGSVMTTSSGLYGVFEFSGVITGTYTLIADVVDQCQCYHGVRTGVEVSGDLVDSKNILLYPAGGCCYTYLPIIQKQDRNSPAKPNPP